MAILPNRVDFTKCEQSTSNRKIIEQKRVVCIVPECYEKSSTSKLKFFKLPIDLVRRNIWLTTIKINPANLKNKSNFVCEKHFAPEHIGYSRLTQNAVPFLNVPSYEPSTYEDINVTGKELNLSPEISNSASQNLNTINKSNEKVHPHSSGSFSEVKIEPVDSSESGSKIDSINTIIAENLECSSADSFTCGTDQNIFTTHFTYKNPVFLQKRIDKYEAELKEFQEKHAVLMDKLTKQKQSAKTIRNNQKINKQLKQMTEFNEIYDNPQMKIPKLIFKRFMIDYENEPCAEDLKRFAAEVHSRSPDAYNYIQKCFSNVLPNVNDLQELLKEITSKNLSDEE